MVDASPPDPIPTALLETWEVSEPSAGFAERVLARTHAAEPAPGLGPQVVALDATSEPAPGLGPQVLALDATAEPTPGLGPQAAAHDTVSRPAVDNPGPSRRRLPRARAARWAGLAAAAAVVAGLVIVRPSVPVSGHRTTASRTTIELGARGVAVAEAGASLRWSVDWLGHATVEQREGDVFYRVEPGGRFDVQTPQGVITVTGTCFGVRTDDETRVAVHEGEVVVHNDVGQLTLGAGDVAYLASAHGPRIGAITCTDATDQAPAAPAPPPDRAVAPPPARATSRRAAPPASGSPPPAATPPSDRAERDEAQQCAKTGDCSPEAWVDPSARQLEALARCGRLLVDSPPFLNDDFSFVFSLMHEREARLSDDDRRVIEAIGRTLHQQLGEQLGPLLLELGVSAPLVDRLSPAQRLHTGLALTDPTYFDEIVAQLARERAGLASPPEDPGVLDPSEQILRLHAESGVEYTRRLSEVLGADTVDRLRRIQTGWPSKNNLGGADCDDAPTSG